MRVNLGIHLGFAINRYPEPDEWAKLVSEELGIKYVQFVSDLLDPSYDNYIIDKQINSILNATNKYGIKIDHTFTSPRYNFLGHPDEKIAKFWFNWLKRFINISSRLSSRGTGCLLGIYSVNDFHNNKVLLEDRIIYYWQQLSMYAEEKNLEYLLWEPMSIKRELGETISETLRLHDRLNDKKSGVPILLNLDVDHGDVSSKNKDDYDPYKWIEKTGRNSPAVHIKQRTKNLYGHKPFTAEHNKEGVIKPDQIIESFKKMGVKETYLYLELSFREREPYDTDCVRDINESVEYWKKYLK